MEKTGRAAYPGAPEPEYEDEPDGQPKEEAVKAH